MVSNRAGTPYGNPLSGRVVPRVSSSQPFLRVNLVAVLGSACGKAYFPLKVASQFRAVFLQLERISAFE
jgi:hypothetical protein